MRAKSLSSVLFLTLSTFCYGYVSVLDYTKPSRWKETRKLRCDLSIKGHSVNINANTKANKNANSGLFKICDRRDAISKAAGFAAISMFTFTVPDAYARAPGSKDLCESILQVQDALNDLRKLQRNWDQYTVIDKEGRAGSTDGARRILGGIAPQSGAAAIENAKTTPLYRINGAFAVIRNASLDNTDDESWLSSFDLMAFDELGERVLYSIQKADGDFYGVLFAAKGTKQISDIFIAARILIDQSEIDFEKMLELLKVAGAPELQ